MGPEGGIGRQDPAVQVHDRDPLGDLFDGGGQPQAFLFGGPERGDIPGGGEDAGDLARLIPCRPWHCRGHP